jgi:hypothetical protein
MKSLTLAISIISFAAAAASVAQDGEPTRKILFAVPDAGSTLILAGLGLMAIGDAALIVFKKGRAARHGA